MKAGLDDDLQNASVKQFKVGICKIKSKLFNFKYDFIGFVQV